MCFLLPSVHVVVDEGDEQEDLCGCKSIDEGVGLIVLPSLFSGDVWTFSGDDVWISEFVVER